MWCGFCGDTFLGLTLFVIQIYRVCRAKHLLVSVYTLSYSSCIVLQIIPSLSRDIPLGTETDRSDRPAFAFCLLPCFVLDPRFNATSLHLTLLDTRQTCHTTAHLGTLLLWTNLIHHRITNISNNKNKTKLHTELMPRLPI